MPLSTLARRTLAGALALAALSVATHTVEAQKTHAASGDHDMEILAKYHITEAGLRNYYKAMENLAKAAMKDPSLQETFEASNASDDEDLAAMAARYDRVPALKGALASAGLTSMEFATFSLSYMQAVMAYGLMTQGPENLRIKELPQGTPKENVEFVRTHQALIQQLDSHMKSLMPPGGADASA